MHATILAHMFTLVETGKVSEPLFAAESTQYPSNQVCTVKHSLLLYISLFYTITNKYYLQTQVKIYLSTLYTEIESYHLSVSLFLFLGFDFDLLS